MARSGVVAAAVVILGVATAHATSSYHMGMYPTAGGAAPTAAALPMLDSKIEVSVRGPIIETVVTQKFSNRTDHAIEATYIFPLPADAAVSAMWIKTGNRTIKAAIERRDQAQRRYEAAVRAGVTGAVLDQERPDVFTQTVTGIPAKGTVEVTLRYDTVARYANGTWELALPMVVAPRYVPGTVSGRPTIGTGRAPDTDRSPDASRVTPQLGPDAGGATTVALEFVEPVTGVTSPTHELTGRAAAYSFVDPHSDHDAVIRWHPTTTAAGWIEAAGTGGFAAVVISAPAAPARKGSTRIVLVLDRAATISGDGLVVVQPFVRSLLGSLGATDKVSVIGAGATAWRTPSAASRSVEQIWTHPGQPFDLTRVLQTAAPDGASIVLVSDGLVTDDRAVLAAAKRLGVPIHVIGVGPAPARGLLTQIAATTGGTIRFLLPSDDLAAAAEATLDDVATPPAPLTVSWGTLAASDVVPAVLPRLGAGQAMLVLAKVKHAQTANARTRGELLSLETTGPTKHLDGATTTAGPLGRRWARTRLEDLLVGSTSEAAITAHALAYGLVSPYTSLVAIGDEVIVEGGVKHSVAVPVSVPSGMSWGEIKREITIDSTVSAVDPTTKQDEDERSATAKNKLAAPAPGRDSREAADDGDREDASAPRAPVSVGSVATVETALDEDEAIGETAALGTRRSVRITVSIGGGVVTRNQLTAGLFALGVRADVGGRSRFGVESSVWLVDGFHGQGRLLLTFARRGIARWFELGAGLGAHLEPSAIGPAGAVSIRFHLPPAPSVAAYLRYDGALLIGSDTREGQHTLTVGVERSF